MLRAIIAAALYMLILAQVVAAPAGDVNWRAKRTRHFILYYANESSSVAEKASASAEEWYAELSRRLGFAPGGVTPVYLYPDRASFSRAVGVGRADTVVGLARASDIRIDASGLFADVEQVLAHEMVHVFIARRLYGYTARLPLWMHEGLAQYLTGDWGDANLAVLQEAVASGSILPLERITVRFPEDPEGRAVAYAQSYSIVRYIAQRYPPGSLPDLLSELKYGRRFETALLYSMGRQPEELEKEWRDHLLEEHGVHRWSQIGTAAVSAAMVLFALLAFRSRILQKRRKAKEFEENTTGSGGLDGPDVPDDRGKGPIRPTDLARPRQTPPTEEETEPQRPFPARSHAPRRRRSVPRSQWASRRARTWDERDSPD